MGEKVAHSLFVYDTIADELPTGVGYRNGVGRILGEWYDSGRKHVDPTRHDHF